MASLLNTVRDLDRLRQIVTVLVKHGFGDIVQRTGLGSLLTTSSQPTSVPPLTIPERARLVLQSLGPSFVKLGQILSTRPDLLPEAWIVELKKLQDEVPPFSFKEARAVIESELGAPLEEIYTAFEERALASASIGQVHRAKLKLDEHTTADVVVKVQRPNIRDTIDRDLDLLYWLARAIERSIPESRIYSPIKAVAEFDRAIRAELDFTMEADNAVRFARNFEGVPTAKFPEVYRHASSRRVLTIEYLPGSKVYEAVKQGMSAEKIAKTTLAILVKMIFEDGFFHADPHPGNILIQGAKEEPVIGFVDLGLVGKLTPQLRDRTIDLMVAAVRDDRRGIADAIYAIGRPTKKVDRQAFDTEVSQLADKYLGKQLKELQFSALIRDLIGGAVRFGLEIPPDFFLVGKALMTCEGVGREIHPELDVLQEMKPYFLQLVMQRYSPERLTTELARTATRIGTASADLPMQAQEVMDDLRKGRLTLRIREPNLLLAAESIGRRIFAGLVTCAFIVSSGILLSREAYFTGILMLFFASFWITSHTVLLWWRSRKKEK